MSFPVARFRTFRLNPAVERPAFEAADRGFAAELGRLDGFVSRTLSVAADGTWTEMVLWRTPEAAQAAAARLPGLATADWLAAVDAATLHVWGGIVAASTRALTAAAGR
jgi:hypothetical protein